MVRILFVLALIGCAGSEKTGQPHPSSDTNTKPEISADTIPANSQPQLALRLLNE